jgi:cyclopropane-fatty-acyl-phospholipid synthase
MDASSGSGEAARLARMPLNLPSPDLPEVRWLRRVVAKVALRTLCAFLGIPVEGRATGARGSGPSILVIDDVALFSRLANGFSMGLGEAYMAGDWESNDLVATLERLAKALVFVSSLVPTRLAARVRRTTIRATPGSSSAAATNATWHYGVEPAFFEDFLGESMTYSCALYSEDCSDLTAGQYRKIDRALDEVGVVSGSRILDIGSGWGSLALRAAARGAHVEAITPVAAQVGYSLGRAGSAGIGNVSFECHDYRSRPASQHDAAVSIEMIEAVGYSDVPEFFRVVAESLRPGGRFLLQFISTSATRMFLSVGRETWIRKYVFPGGDVLSREYVLECAVANGLILGSSLDLSSHYVRTLAAWQESFSSSAGARPSGPAFSRTWSFYLATSEAGFRAGDLGCWQLCFTKEGA